MIFSFNDLYNNSRQTTFILKTIFLNYLDLFLYFRSSFTKKRNNNIGFTNLFCVKS